MNRYWRKYFWEHYNVKIKKIKILYNPISYWGVMPSENYILWGYNGYGFKVIITDKIFHSKEQIEQWLKEDLEKHKKENE